MSMLKESGYKALVIVEDIGLLVIAVSTVIAMSFEIGLMIKAMNVTLADLLLLFIYLEVLAMVGIYLKSGKLPVRMPLYIAIVALARYMILDMKKPGYIKNAWSCWRCTYSCYIHPRNSIWSRQVPL